MSAKLGRKRWRKVGLAVACKKARGGRTMRVRESAPGVVSWMTIAVDSLVVSMLEGGVSGGDTGANLSPFLHPNTQFSPTTRAKFVPVNRGNAPQKNDWDANYWLKYFIISLIILFWSEYKCSFGLQIPVTCETSSDAENMSLLKIWVCYLTSIKNEA